MKRETIFSPCRLYRYALWREWDFTNPRALQVIGLNPSTADEALDDPTIRRCIDYAKRWGFGALCMTNLFAWRDTQPEAMKLAADPIGPDNETWLLRAASACEMTLAAWGTNGNYRDRASYVMGLMPFLRAIQINKDGSPKHPLYCRADLVPIPFPTLQQS